MKRRTRLWTLGWILALVLSAIPARAAAEDCDCDALARELRGLSDRIDALQATLENYRRQLRIPGRIAIALEAYEVRAAEGECQDDEGGLGLEGGWRLCFPLDHSAAVIPFISELLERWGYEAAAFREAAAEEGEARRSLADLRDALRRARELSARCRCDP